MNERMRVNLFELLPIIEEQLASGKEVCFTPKGSSMLPLLVPDRDEVVLTAPPEKLKKYDLPLYRRASGQFVLHRVVKVKKDGSYVMCGDNQYVREDGIKHGQIVGVVESFSRNGKKIKANSFLYGVYCVILVKFRKIQGLYMKIKGIAAKVLKR